MMTDMTTLGEIILSKLSVNIEFLAPEVNRFLYWNISSPSFAKHLAEKRMGI